MMIATAKLSRPVPRFADPGQTRQNSRSVRQADRRPVGPVIALGICNPLTFAAEIENCVAPWLIDERQSGGETKVSKRLFGS